MEELLNFENLQFILNNANALEGLCEQLNNALDIQNSEDYQDESPDVHQSLLLYIEAIPDRNSRYILDPEYIIVDSIENKAVKLDFFGNAKCVAIGGKSEEK